MNDAQPADAIALAASIARGELSATEALQAAIGNVERLNARINAVCNPAYEHGLAAARAIDAELAGLGADQRRALLRRRPLLGVPSLLKDLTIAAVGLPCTMGSRMFGAIHANADAELVARYRRAGLVLFGRTTSPEMGISPSTEAVAYGGPTRNPWNPAHSSGGSSGGAAAAVAAGMVRIAHASDGAGSIRIPSNCCGVLGLKPSRGLMPAGPFVGEGWGGLATEHVVSWTVRDSAQALDISAGADTGAPYAAPPVAGSYLDAARIDVASSRSRAPARIALLARTLDGVAIDPEVEQAVRQAGALFAGLGHALEEAAPRITTEEIVRPVALVMACGTSMLVDAALRERGLTLENADLEPVTRSAVQIGRDMSAAQYLELVVMLHALTRRIAEFFSPVAGLPARTGAARGFDFMLMPVLAEPAARLGRFAMNWPDYVDYRLGPTGLIHYSPFTPLANMTGQPAISVPFATSKGGLPIGVQIVGRFGDDAGVLRLAAEIEAARPWIDHRPHSHRLTQW